MCTEEYKTPYRNGMYQEDLVYWVYTKYGYEMVSRRQMKKHYKEKWGEIFHYRFPDKFVNHNEITEWVTGLGLKEHKDYFTDQNRRRWYFREKKWAMSIKLIYG